MSERLQRRLAAIVFADVAGYSRLVATDEEATLGAFRAHRRDFIEPLIAAEGGRIASTAGDGLLLEFASIVEAVKCAQALQRGMAARDTSLPEDRRIRFRLGVHVGDVVAEGEDLLGDGVNVAARIEALAEPGGIALSDDAYRQVRDRLADNAWRDGGSQSVKNIPRPVHIWHWRPDDDAAAPSAVRVLDRPAIAVLPFDNLSGDGEQEYFIDGITEDIITALSHWRWFPVIARNSTFSYKGKHRDVTRIAEELGARYVLEGSMRKAGRRVRINAQLIDGSNGHHVWAKRYDRDLDDIFALQDEITETIVTAIEPELGRAEQQRVASKPPGNLDAWDDSIRALWHINQSTRADFAEARALLVGAIEQLPEWSGALSLLAMSHVFSIMNGWEDDIALAHDEIFQLSRRALATNDGDWLAHTVLGYMQGFTGAFDIGLEALGRAVDLNPSAVRAYHFLGGTLSYAGRPEEALSPLETALRLNPRDPFRALVLAVVSQSYLLLGDFEAALAHADRAVAAEPGNNRVHQRRVAALGHLGREEQAGQALAELLRVQPGLSSAHLRATHVFRNPEHMALFHDGLRKAGFEG